MCAEQWLQPIVLVATWLWKTLENLSFTSFSQLRRDSRCGRIADVRIACTTLSLAPSRPWICANMDGGTILFDFGPAAMRLKHSFGQGNTASACAPSIVAFKLARTLDVLVVDSGCGGGGCAASSPGIFADVCQSTLNILDMTSKQEQAATVFIYIYSCFFHFFFQSLQCGSGNPWGCNQRELFAFSVDVACVRGMPRTSQLLRRRRSGAVGPRAASSARRSRTWC